MTETDSYDIGSQILWRQTDMTETDKCDKRQTDLIETDRYDHRQSAMTETDRFDIGRQI